ncbi:MAG: DUF3631 domain-containing protein [Candidatus Rokubacteria bacterium]|nr:DUF3631 domain-containing protein [Candidatus Rokubacteria bacterium]
MNTPITRMLDALMAHGSSPKKRGANYAAKCPAHDDQRASLSVSEGSDGRALVFCHAGCAVEEILTKLGLTLKDLMSADGRHTGGPVATYDYKDRDDRLLYHVVRFPPKEFRQCRPDGKGGWLWNLNGVKRVLYRLPELLAADPGEPVFLVEGEKDVERLRSLGLVSTTNPGGACKWRDDYNEALRGRHVIIVPDNDEPGRKHASRVAGAIKGVAALVKIVKLDGLPEKGDVSDWLDAGHTADQLRALVEAAPMAADEGGLQGRPLALCDPEPWPEPVDGALLANAILMGITRYVVLPKGGAVALVLWVLHAHAQDASDVSPKLCLRSATKRSGKTQTMTVLSHLVPRPYPSSNITAASLFRIVEKYRPTLLIDEADSFLRDNEDLRGILNSGHTRRFAFVVRCVGDDNEPRQFSTWCPQALALIGNLADTLEDRSIVLTLRRKGPGEQVERLREDRIGAEMEPLCRQAFRWAKDNLDALRRADPDVPPGLNDRAADNWRPLIAIADLCGDSWGDEARWAAGVLSEAVDEGEASPRVQVLADLRDLFRERGADRLGSEVIVKALAEMEDRPWGEWRRGHPLTAHQLARLLRPFDIRPCQIWADGTNTRGYMAEDLRESFDRYLLPSEGPNLPPEVLDPLDPARGKHFGDKPEVLEGDDLADRGI